MKDRFDLIVFSIFVVLIISTLVFAQGKEEKGKVAYPTGYRDWAHVKSMLIFDSKHPLLNPFGGLHHIYGSAKGLSAYNKDSEKFPDGTVIVFDLLEANRRPGGLCRRAKEVYRSHAERFQKIQGNRRMGL